MIGPKPFDAIDYKEPKLDDRRKPIVRFVGIDTEAYTDGSCFMICSSEGDVWKPRDIPGCFFDPKFAGAHFVLFNMKYDTGAILSSFMFPRERRLLIRYGKVTTEDDYSIDYLPHKHLSIGYEKRRVEFWDVAQYYRTSLDKAAQKYLGQSKIDVGSKRFSRRRVKREWKQLAAYCVKDALLTRDLAYFFKSKVEGFGIEVKTLYSPASISATYIHANAGLVDVFDLWRFKPEVLRFAHESYQGGKFECTRRGTFEHAYEYDIVSAYPWEMMNLLDIKGSEFVKSKTRPDGAVYGWLRVRINHTRLSVPPCHGTLLQGVRVYAHGSYYATITIAEYEYMTGNGIDVSVYDAWWMIPKTRSYPYQKVISFLFDIKDKYRSDPVSYSVAKIMMNGYYGKMANVNEKLLPADDYPDMPADKFGEVTRFQAGAAWNPLYASMITANTRIKISEVQMKLGDDCLAVHTDSVISLRQLPDSDLSKNIGGIKLEIEGPGMLLMSGLYDLADHTACRGFEMPEGFTWTHLLSDHPLRSKYLYRQKRVVSWTQASAWGREQETNQFQSMPKMVDINADVKRIWNLSRARGRHLLGGLLDSGPRIHTEVRKPW